MRQMHPSLRLHSSASRIGNGTSGGSFWTFNRLKSGFKWEVRVLVLVPIGMAVIFVSWELARAITGLAVLLTIVLGMWGAVVPSATCICTLALPFHPCSSLPSCPFLSFLPSVLPSFVNSVASFPCSLSFLPSFLSLLLFNFNPCCRRLPFCRYIFFRGSNRVVFKANHGNSHAGPRTGATGPLAGFAKPAKDQARGPLRSVLGCFQQHHPLHQRHTVYGSTRSLHDQPMAQPDCIRQQLGFHLQRHRAAPAQQHPARNHGHPDRHTLTRTLHLALGGVPLLQLLPYLARECQLLLPPAAVWFWEEGDGRATVCRDRNPV